MYVIKFEIVFFTMMRRKNINLIYSKVEKLHSLIYLQITNFKLIG